MEYLVKFHAEKHKFDRLNDLDVFAIYEFFEKIVEDTYARLKMTITDYSQQKETYIALWCAGFYDQNNFAPSITEVRKHEYYSDIDFMKLLLRGYDLVKELNLNVNEMFKQYSEADQKRVFKNETRYTFLRKIDPTIDNKESNKTFANI